MLSEGVIGDKLLLAIDAFQKCCGTAVRWGYGDFKSQNDETEASTGHRSYYIQGISSLVMMNFRPPYPVAPVARLRSNFHFFAS